MENGTMNYCNGYSSDRLLYDRKRDSGRLLRPLSNFPFLYSFYFFKSFNEYRGITRMHAVTIHRARSPTVI